MSSTNRIAVLEQQAHAQRKQITLLGIGFIVALSTAVFALATRGGGMPEPPADRVVNAQRLVLQDPDSGNRIEIGFEGEGQSTRRGYVRFYDRGATQGEIVVNAEGTGVMLGHITHAAQPGNSGIVYGNWRVGPESMYLQNGSEHTVAQFGATALGDGSLVLNDRFGDGAISLSIADNPKTGDRAGLIGTYDTKDPLIRSLLAPFIED